jgi:hypothetical protein
MVYPVSGTMKPGRDRHHTKSDPGVSDNFTIFEGLNYHHAHHRASGRSDRHYIVLTIKHEYQDDGAVYKVQQRP